VSVLFVLSVNDLTLWERTKATAAGGAAIAAVLSLACFLLGRRMRDRIDASRASIDIVSTPAAGGERRKSLSSRELSSLAIDPSLRSLGADVLLVAVTKEGARLPIAEGEPHSGQVRELAERMSHILGVPIERPKFTAH
jgi:hypothetical protein